MKLLNMLKGLRRAIDRNAYYCKKGNRVYKKGQLELWNLLVETKPDLNAINYKLNNAGEQIIDLKTE